MAEQMEMPSGLWIGCAKGTMYCMGAQWHRMANTVELSVCGGDAALC